MGCIIVSVERVGEGLRAGGHRVGNGLMVNAERVGEGLVVLGSRFGEGLRVMAERVGESLRVSASMVCDVGFPTIEIIPDNIWLTPSNLFTADVEVITRTDWKVLK